ncbi:MAG: hypothetical protein AAF702_15925 [Chloroflexota bacterium]
MSTDFGTVTIFNATSSKADIYLNGEPLLPPLGTPMAEQAIEEQNSATNTDLNSAQFFTTPYHVGRLPADNLHGYARFAQNNTVSVSLGTTNTYIEQYSVMIYHHYRCGP